MEAQAREEAGQSGGDGAVQGLLTVLDTLRREPVLVSVVLDFLRELGYGGNAEGERLG